MCFFERVCAYSGVSICLISAAMFVNPQKWTNYRTAAHSAISHLTFISKPRTGVEKRGMEGLGGCCWYGEGWEYPWKPLSVFSPS